MRKQIIRYIVAGVALFMVVLTGTWGVKQYRLQCGLAEKVIRFHVLANSDTAEDQQLKLKVRDAVGGYMQEQIQGITDKEACKRMVSEQLSEIEQIAGAIVEKEGFSYQVHAELAMCKFPKKTYGTYTFPAGKYEALRITIGAGEGQNWWCVMYPNMCFENSMYEVIDEKSKDALRAVLEEEEYRAVLDSGNFKLRFRLLELFQ